MSARRKYDLHKKEMLDVIAKNPGITSGELLRLIAVGMNESKGAMGGVLNDLMRHKQVVHVRNYHPGPACREGFYFLYPLGHAVMVQAACDLDMIQRPNRRVNKAVAPIIGTFTLPDVASVPQVAPVEVHPMSPVAVSAAVQRAVRYIVPYGPDKELEVTRAEAELLYAELRELLRK